MSPRLPNAATWSDLLTCHLNLLRRLSHLLMPPLLTLPLLTAPAPAVAAPATDADINFYTTLSGWNICIARSNGVEFNTAVRISAETIAAAIQGKHQGLVQQAGPKALDPEQILQASANQAVLAASQFCPKEVPADIMKRVQEALNRSGDKTAPASKPAATPAAKPAATPAAKPAAAAPAAKP